MKDIMGIRIRRTMRKRGRRALFSGILAVLLAGAALLFLYHRLPQEATFPSSHLHERKVAVEMGRLRSIRQPFDSPRAGLAGVCLELEVGGADVGRLHGELRFTLLDEHGSPVEEQLIPTAALTDYGSYTVAFPPLRDSAGRHYTLLLTAAQPAAGETIVAFFSEGNGTLDFAGAPAGHVLTADGIYRTSRIGSLYNGRLPAGQVTWLIALCVLSVVLLSALTAWLFVLWFFPDGNGGEEEAAPSGKD